MASASRALLRSLLRQSDRHPVGRLDGVDLEGADPRLVERLLARGVLREVQPLGHVDDRVVAVSSRGCQAVSIDGGEADADIDPRTLRQLEIDLPALAELVGHSAGLVGPIERIDQRLISLGRLSAAAVFLARNLRDAVVPEVARSIRQLIGSGAAVLLTPTERELGLEARRMLDDGRIRLAAVETLLPDVPSAELHLDLAAALHDDRREAPRLVIRRQARTVRLDGTDVPVAPQPFDLLVVLADEALEARRHLQRRDIEDRLFGKSVHGHDVSDIVRRLRDALAPAVGGKDAAARLIENKPRLGYRLALEPHEIDLA